MTRFKASITICQAIDIVVKALLNPDNQPYWSTDLDKFETVKGKPNQN